MRVATGKVRIYELSKVLGLSSKELMDMLEKNYNVVVKSHSSTIDQDIADKIVQSLSASSPPVEKPAVKPLPAKPPQPEKKQPASPPSKATAEPEKNAHSTPKQPVQPIQPQSQPSRLPEKRDAVAHKPSPAAVAESQQAPATARQTTMTKPSAPAQSPRPAEHNAKPSAPATTNTQPMPQAAAAVATPKPAPAVEEAPAEVVKIEAPLSIAELAVKLKKRETELIRHLFMKGIMVTVNQTMQVEDAMALAREMGFEAEGPPKKSDTDLQVAPELRVRQAKGKHLKPRSPVVSIMGHVDHGKTSLLDAIRETRHKIVDTEAGGITQSIGAYTVFKDDHKIVFIDTPGHEAFTTMRMRGAQATDIAILVVAADDGVMPQSIEAINHAKAANIPIIVAINKIDKPGADPDKVLVQLSEHGLTPEKWGGDTIAVEVSALQKLGLDELLEMIALVAELQELKADPAIPAEGVVIEAYMDKGKGPVATVLVQNGTLHVGENILLTRVGGRVRALINDFGERVKSAGPSTPVEVLGLNEVPQAGETFVVVRNDKEFKRLLAQSTSQEREQRLSKMAAPGLIDRDTGRKDFYLILKADTQGSVEAITASILQLATEEVSIHILHAGTGDVSEADVLLATASNAIIIAFNVKEETNAQRIAVDRGIQVRPYDIIYHVIEDMEKLMLGMLSPETEEQETGVIEVRQLFSFGKTTIAGCYVLEGKATRNGLARVFRNGKELFKGTLDNLKRFKEDAREVAAGYECGVSFDKYNDLQPGDVIRMYTVKEIERTSL